MENTSEQVTTTQNDSTELKTRASIQLAVEIKSSFELYAYRIIGHETFQNQIEDLVNFYKSQIKKAK